MAYLGREPVIGQFQKIDSILGYQNGSNQSFQMLVSGIPFTPESVYQLTVVKNGSALEPGVDFSVNSTILSFPTAPVALDRIWIMAYGSSLFTGQVSDSTVTTAKIADATINYNKLSGDAIATIIGDIITFGI